jgi:PAS domain-containing serine/threonine kinase
VPRPQFLRRASHDLFECIEQSEHKRLSEDQARYVFSQIVEAVHYLDSLGITHRDIKDENLVIDKNLKVFDIHSTIHAETDAHCTSG